MAATSRSKRKGQGMTSSTHPARTGTHGATVTEGTRLEGIRGKVFLDRYALKGEDGAPLEEFPEQMWRRVAGGIAAVERSPEKQAEWTEKFYDLLSGFKFVPGGRILSGAGTGHQVTFYNCFVVGLGEDPLDPNAPRKPMLDPAAARPAFFSALAQMTDIMSRSGGVGMNLSALPPKGTPIRTEGRGAAGAVRPTVALSLDHPDVGRLLEEKDGPNLAHVDIAVIVPPRFDQALAEDAAWTPQWGEMRGETVPARELWARVTAREGRSVGILRPESATLAIEDSRDAIVGGAESAALALFRGEAPVIDFSALRPKGAYIKTVNGTSSGPVAWMYLYDAVARLDDGASPGEKGVIWFGEIASVITGKTIQQGGSRRGALMLMLDDDHPDIEEFIAAKHIDPVTGRPVMIEHANMSLCISDAFMAAVKADLPWDLKWQGRVVRTVRARDIWDQICTAAWTTAEPGVVFMQRYQERSNTWYFENIRCVNPCVTGDTLVLTAKGPRRIDALAASGDAVDIISPQESNAAGESHIRRVTSVFATGIKPVYLLKTEEGHAVRLTADHRVLTDAGWIEAQHLTPERRIHVFDAQVGYGYATLASLTPDGEEMVYDLTEPEAHLFVGNGLVLHNCGEQGLPPGGVCNLGALNLAAYVSDDGRLLEDDLARDAAHATRFLDNVIDATPYFSPLHMTMQHDGTRRTGLGTMGLADALIKMRVAYGSAESLEGIERIYGIIRDASYRASVELAGEKEPFGRFDKDKYLEGWFIQRLPADVREGIAEHGIRNGVILTQAPTGTTSLLAGVSSGIEPVYDFAMKRVDRLGEHIMYHPLLQEWMDAHPGEERPEYFVGAKDLTPEEHVVVQARVQEYTDSSISKTSNAPNDHSIDEVKRLYTLAYDLGCKGVTYYRDGSRDAVLTSVSEAPKAARSADDGASAPAAAPEPALAAVPAQMTPAAVAATPLQPALMPAAPDVVEPSMPAWVLEGRLKRRPGEMSGFTRNVAAPEGKVNITINSDDEGPLELFINIGRAGSDVAALAEALGRLISLQLRLPSTMSQEERLRQVANQLRGIGGSRSIGFGANRVLSLPDAVAQAIYRHLEEHPAAPKPTPLAPATQLSLPVSNDPTPGIFTPAGSASGATPLSATGSTVGSAGSLLSSHASAAPSGASSAAPVASGLAASAPTYASAAAHAGNGHGAKAETASGAASIPVLTGNLCPQCGSSGAYVFEEGCKKCHYCGYSEC